jgi:hypothetical protein
MVFGKVPVALGRVEPGLFVPADTALDQFSQLVTQLREVRDGVLLIWFCKQKADDSAHLHWHCRVAIVGVIRQTCRRVLWIIATRHGSVLHTSVPALGREPVSEGERLMHENGWVVRVVCDSPTAGFVLTNR